MVETAPFSPAALLDFFHLIFQLKKTPRTGWVKRNIEPGKAESIADHMYRMAMICMVLPLGVGVSRERCIMMALVHDLAEAIVGDITPDCGVPEHDKHQMEKEALEEITKDLSPESAMLIKGLWGEYEAGSTAEARLVKQVDKFEFALQAWEYGREFAPLDLWDFVAGVKPKLQDPHLKAIYDLMVSRTSEE